MRVVLPAPEEPTSAVRMPGRKAPEQLRSSCSIVVPSQSPRRAIDAGSSAMPCVKQGPEFLKRALPHDHHKSPTSYAFSHHHDMEDDSS